MVDLRSRQAEQIRYLDTRTRVVGRLSDRLKGPPVVLLPIFASLANASLFVGLRTTVLCPCHAMSARESLVARMTSGPTAKRRISCLGGKQLEQQQFNHQ